MSLLCRLIEPYSKMQVDFVAGKINLLHEGGAGVDTRFLSEC